MLAVFVIYSFIQLSCNGCSKLPWTRYPGLPDLTNSHPSPMMFVGLSGLYCRCAKGGWVSSSFALCIWTSCVFCDVLMLQKKLLWWEVGALLLLDLLCFRNFYFLFIIMLGAVVKVGSPGLWQLEVRSSRLFCCLSFLVRNQLYSDGFSFVCDLVFFFFTSIQYPVFVLYT